MDVNLIVDYKFLGENLLFQITKNVLIPQILWPISSSKSVLSWTLYKWLIYNTCTVWLTLLCILCFLNYRKLMWPGMCHTQYWINYIPEWKYKCIEAKCFYSNYWCCIILFCLKIITLILRWEEINLCWYAY